MAGDMEQSAAGTEDATSRGFTKALNLGLMLVALCCGLLAMIRPFYVAPPLMEVYKQVKVPMPGLTLLAIDAYPFVSGLLLVGALGCGVVMGIWGHRRQTIIANGAYLLLAVGWMMLFTIAIKLPMVAMESHR